MGIFDWFRKTLPSADGIATRAEGMMDRQSEDAFVQVPEGFFVKTWPGELKAPSFTLLDGGVVLASTGPSGDMNVEVFRALFDGVEKAMLRPRAPVRIAAKVGTMAGLLRADEPQFVSINSMVVWTLQEGILDGWSETPLLVQEVLRRFHRIAMGHGAVERTQQVVLARKSLLNEASGMLRLIRGLRIDLRELVPDGTAVVEVRRPDGTIISGLPGTPRLEENVGFEPWWRK